MRVSGFALILSLAWGGYAQGDQIINDALVVQGSFCAGNTCNPPLSDAGQGLVTIRGSAPSVSYTNDGAAILDQWFTTALGNRFEINRRGNRVTALSAGLYDMRLGVGVSMPAVSAHLAALDTPTVRLEQLPFTGNPSFR
jgi:hypothetical protein